MASRYVIFAFIVENILTLFGGIVKHFYYLYLKNTFFNFPMIFHGSALLKKYIDELMKKMIIPIYLLLYYVDNLLECK